MRIASLSIGSVAIACALLGSPTTARAAPETWVSGTGSDAGSCPITAPCRTFAYASTRTNSGGSINVLSPGSFGGLDIAKPLSIIADGAEARVETTSGDAAITIATTGPVLLRGLTIRGAVRGILVFNSGPVHVQNCAITGGTTNGIQFAPSSGVRELFVTDTVVTDAGETGISIGPTGNASANVVLDRVRVNNAASNGILVSGISNTGTHSVTVRDSVVAGNTNHGILVNDDGGGSTKVMIEGTAVVGNTVGINASGVKGTIYVGGSTVHGNGLGLTTASGGSLISYGTNRVNGNTADGLPTSTIGMK